MEDVNAIHRIFKNLKYEMDNNGWVYQWHLGDERDYEKISVNRILL